MTARPLPFLVRLCVLTVVYCAAGWLGLLLAVPPGHATAVWPPAGIALAALLLGGRQLWPGVWLGSCLVNLWVSFDRTGSLTLQTTALAGLIGGNAVLQVLVGVWLIRRWIGFPTPLYRERDLFLFLAVAGPIHSLVNCTLSVTLLVLLGVTPWSQAPFNWFTWWVGDALGGMVFAPVLLILFAQPRAVWRPRLITVALPMLCQFGVFTLFFLSSQTQEEARLSRQLDQTAHLLTARVNERFLRTERDLRRFRGYPSFEYALSFPRPRQQLPAQAQQLMAESGFVRSLAFYYLVPDERRETLQRLLGQPVPLEERYQACVAAGVFRPSAGPGRRPYLVWFEPAEALPAGAGLGHDGSGAAFLRELVAVPFAGSQTLLSAAGGDALPGRPHGALLTLCAYPINQPHRTEDQRRAILSGILIADCDLNQLVQQASDPPLLPGLSAEVHPVGHQQPPARAGVIRTSYPVRLGAADWQLWLSATPEFQAAMWTWQTWSALVLGLGFTGLLGAILLLVTGRTAVVREEVLVRTAELAQEVEERKRAEQTLQASEERFRTLVEKSFEGITCYDQHAKLCYVSPGNVRIDGRTAEETLGTDGFSYVHPDHRAVAQQVWAEMLANPEQVYSLTLQVSHKDGSWLWVEATAQNCLANPVVACVVVNWRNVSERKRTEEELTRTQANLAALLENTQDAVWSVDRDVRLLLGNSAFRELHQATFGLQPVAGQGLEERIPATQFAEFGQRARLLYERALSGERCLAELNLTTRDGPRCFECSFNPILAVSGVTGVVVDGRDITERRHIEARLRDLNENLERLVAERTADLLRSQERLVQRARLMEFGASVGLSLARSCELRQALRFCAEALVQHLDAAFARIWTLNEPEGVLELQASAGMYCHLDGPHSRVPLGQFKIGRIAAAAQPHLTNDVGNDPQVSDRAWARREGMVSFAGYPLQVEGHVVGVMAMFARQPLDQATLDALAWVAAGIAQSIQRRRAEEALEASLREKEALLKEVHHRVKNNLQVVSSLLNLQANALQDPTVRAALTESQNRVRSMALIHDNLSRSANLAQVDLARHVESLCAHLYRTYGVDPGRIELAIAIDDIQFDLDQAMPCGLIINELVTNALKYAFPPPPEGGRPGRIGITIACGTNASYTLEVADNGIGLPPGVDLTCVSSLGLQLVRDLTQQLRGRLSVTAQGGTRFRISFGDSRTEGGSHDQGTHSHRRG